MSRKFIWFVWFQATHARGSTKSQRQKFPLFHVVIKCKWSESTSCPNMNNNCTYDSFSVD